MYIKIENIEEEEFKYLYYNENKTFKQLAEFYKISVGTVYNLLKKWNLRKLTKYIFNKDSFNVFTPEGCYWAGFIAADGNISTGRLTIMLNSIDIGHINKFCDFMKLQNRNIEEVIAGCANTNCSRLRLSSVELANSLFINFNIVSNKSLILLPPKEIPEDLIRHYIRGFFDGDGCISWCKSNNSPEFSITTGSYDILNWIKTNIKKNVNVGNPSILKRKNSNCFSLKFGGSQAYKIMDWLYENTNENIRLDRKFEKHNGFKR